MEEIKCNRCGYEGVPKLIRKDWDYEVDGHPVHKFHIGTFCPACGKWFKWLPQTDELRKQFPKPAEKQ
ncbi:MAG: hypothetical protein WC565_05515 [Parcubacteria group bacterium]|jgi:hypothetical protein